DCRPDGRRGGLYLDAPDRRSVVDPGPAAVCAADGGAGGWGAEYHPGHGPHRLDRDCPPGARAGLVAQRIGLRARLAFDGRRHGPRLLLLIALIVTACSNQPAPSPPAPPATRTPSPNATSVPPTAVLVAPPTPTPSPLELVVCQTGEPSSLYLYGEDLTARAGI